MKKIFILTLLFVMIVTGCKKEEDSNFEEIIKDISYKAMKCVGGYVEYEGDTTKDITMTIKEGTLTNSSATIVIKDLTGKDFIYDDLFSICKIIDNKCISFKNGYTGVVNLIAYMVYENNPMEFEVNWKWEYGELKPGEYKLIKRTSTSNDDESYSFSVNFTIE